MATLKELSKRKELFTPGHRACLGCGAAIIARQVVLAAQSSGADIVVGCATGCLEVVSTIYPYTAWESPFIHCAFENAAATVSGVVAAYNSLKRKGKITKDMKFIAFGGDGGTYDIGFQSLSGAMERGHDMLYVCYNNEAYMNTSIQRSSATPFGANTTTAPAGRVKQGKEQFRKDLTECIVAHRVPYVAQSSVGFWSDLTRKTERALSITGPKFLNVLQPCQLGWGYPADQTIQLGKLAVDTCFWPLYEVENGVYKINYKPKVKKPISDYLKTQTRFKHLFKPANAGILEVIQADVDKRWAELLKKAGEA
jgi:pyruvate ferredoxin oxidoreductase beta subunit